MSIIGIPEQELKDTLANIDAASREFVETVREIRRFVTTATEIAGTVAIIVAAIRETVDRGHPNA